MVLIVVGRVFFVFPFQCRVSEGFFTIASGVHGGVIRFIVNDEDLVFFLG